MKKNSSLSSMATDKISFLPDCLLHHIFSFMDIKLVVQCSVLSKRWRFLWINMPTINFHSPYEDLWNFKLNKKQKIEEESAIRYFIEQVLSRNRSSLWDIKKLTFSSFESNSTIFYHLFHFTETHKVQELSIRVNGYCSIGWSGCFPNRLEFLKSLSIECLVSNLCLEHIFSSCPNLESLALRRYSFSGDSINSSKLKYLHISSYSSLTKKRELVLFTPNLTSFEFESFLPVLKFAGNLPKLDKVKLKVYKSYAKRPYSLSEEKENEFVAKKLMALLIELKNVESLTLSSFAAEVLSFLPTSFKVPRDVLQNLSHLKLKINFRRVRMPYQIMSYLLKGSSLDSFIIEQRFSRFNASFF